MTSFSQMDGLTAALWRELMLQALPIRTVTPQEYAEMTRDLAYLDDEPTHERAENRMAKLEPIDYPEGFKIDLVGTNVRITCNKCNPKWSKMYGHKPEKEDQVCRAARSICGHVSAVHNKALTFAAALQFVEAAQSTKCSAVPTSKKADAPIAQTASPFPFAPPYLGSRCKL
jgi:hypothetical protein